MTVSANAGGPDITYSGAGREQFAEDLGKYRKEIETRADTMINTILKTNDFGSDTAIKDDDKRLIQDTREGIIQACMDAIAGIMGATNTSGENVEDTDKSIRTAIESTMDEIKGKLKG